ncbi:hypothetical protein SARC_00683 [Sphaeroforma arctica JP610]|uniref:HMG box domain-containing protein n=1 Tax=Sphaeroforma arctica JP610 TaxID=667725 RepID=A0A0L0GE99_9EUKA|nr:hypothetical protein SARC_00683 [Sphaeroforma arctica JP610]KNC87206.1 hypothetical protein SARC_00683 [Sphaeroforma arctica JP610]|eukprot:XP_014161108.1 hypothetical protein SARC_00683 [Sphaeroforma arctica JP610]
MSDTMDGKDSATEAQQSVEAADTKTNSSTTADSNTEEMQKDEAVAKDGVEVTASTTENATLEKTETPAAQPESKEASPEPVKTDTKQDASEKTDSEAESEDGEPSVALFNADPVISGKRQRTTTDRLATHQPVVKRAKAQPKGKGTPLGQISMIEEKLKKHKTDDLHDLHRLCFGSKGSRLEVRKNLRLFKGFDYDSNPAIKDKTQNSLEKRHMPALRTMCDVICISHSGDKETLMDNIMDFLNSPNESECVAEKKPKAKAKTSGKKKTSKKTAKASKPERAPSAYNLFIKHNRQKAVTKFPDVKNTEIMSKMSEMWKECSKEEKAKYTKMAEDAKAALGNTSVKKSVKTSAKPNAKKQKPAESSEDDESEEDDDEEEAAEGDSDDDAPIAKKAKTGPTDNEIKKEIRKIVKKVGAGITFGQVRKGLTESFPTLDITQRKAELKKMATTILQG